MAAHDLYGLEKFWGRKGTQPPAASSSSLPHHTPSVPSAFSSGFVLPPPPPSIYPSSIPLAKGVPRLPAPPPGMVHQQFPLSHHKPGPTLKAKLPRAQQAKINAAQPPNPRKVAVLNINSDPDHQKKIVDWALKAQHVLASVPNQMFVWWESGKKQKVVKKFNKFLFDSFKPYITPPFLGVHYLVAEFLRREPGKLPSSLATEWGINVSMEPKTIQNIFVALGEAGLVGGGGDVTAVARERRNPNDQRPDRLKLYGVGVEGMVQKFAEREQAATRELELVAGDGGEGPVTKRARTSTNDAADEPNGSLPSTNPRPKLLTTTSSSSSIPTQPQDPSPTQLGSTSLAWALQIVPLLPSSLPSSPLDSTRQADFLALPVFQFLPPPIPQAPYLLSIFKIHSGALTWKTAEKVGKEAVPSELDSRKVVAIFKAWKKAGLGTSSGSSTSTAERRTSSIPPNPSTSSLTSSTNTPLFSTSTRDESPSNSSRRSSSSNPTSSTSEARAEEIRLRLDKLKSLVPPIPSGSSSPGLFASASATAPRSYTILSQSPNFPSEPHSQPPILSNPSSSRPTKVEDPVASVPSSSKLPPSDTRRTTPRPPPTGPRADRQISSLAAAPSMEDGRSAQAAGSIEDDEEEERRTTNSTSRPLPLPLPLSTSSSSLKRKREAEFPEGWVLVRSKTWGGASYYFCKETRETR